MQRNLPQAILRTRQSVEPCFEDKNTGTEAFSSICPGIFVCYFNKLLKFHLLKGKFLL